MTTMLLSRIKSAYPGFRGEILAVSFNPSSTNANRRGKGPLPEPGKRSLTRKTLRRMPSRPGVRTWRHACTRAPSICASGPSRSPADFAKGRTSRVARRTAAISSPRNACPRHARASALVDLPAWLAPRSSAPAPFIPTDAACRNNTPDCADCATLTIQSVTNSGGASARLMRAIRVSLATRKMLGAFAFNRTRQPGPGPAATTQGWRRKNLYGPSAISRRS